MATKKTKAPVSAKKGNSKMKAVKIGAGVAVGVAAAIAAGYLMYNKSTAPQRKKIKAWAMKMRKEVATEVKKLKHVSAAEYGRIIDKAMTRYESLKDATPAELMMAAQELKSEWKQIQAEAMKAMKMKPVAKKAAPKRKAAAKKKE